MGIFGAFYTGVSGLSSQGFAMSVIGNNIANINTVGFKGGRTTFSDLLSQTLSVGGGVNPVQVGLGSVVGGVQQIFTQGSLQTTSEATNVAIQGNGFFVVRKEGVGQVYTRAGNFSFDKEGFLVNPAGFRVQGWSAAQGAETVDTTTAIGDIRIPTGLVDPPRATTLLQFIANLNADAVPDQSATAEIDQGTQTFRTSIVVFDSLGSAHTLSFVMVPTDTTGDGALDQWEWAVTVDGGEVNGGVPGTPVHPLRLRGLRRGHERRRHPRLRRGRQPHGGPDHLRSDRRTAHTRREH